MNEKIKNNNEKILEIITRNIRWIILFICLITVFVIIEDVFDNEIENFDVTCYNFLDKYIIREKITPIVKVITEIGSRYFVIPATIIVCAFIKNKKINIAFIVNLVIATILNIILKNIFHRQRPTENILVVEKGYSLPSGHSMINMALYGFLIYLIFKRVKNKYVKWPLIILLSILVLLIGISRIYLGAHYASDVIAGFLISIAYLALYTSLLKNFVKIEAE